MFKFYQYVYFRGETDFIVLDHELIISFLSIRFWKEGHQLVKYLKNRFALFLDTSTVIIGQEGGFLMMLFLQYAFNLFSHNASILSNGYNEEEMKMVKETRKIWVSRNGIFISPYFALFS